MIRWNSGPSPSLLGKSGMPTLCPLLEHVEEFSNLDPEIFDWCWRQDVLTCRENQTTQAKRKAVRKQRQVPQALQLKRQTVILWDCVEQPWSLSWPKSSHMPWGHSNPSSSPLTLSRPSYTPSPEAHTHALTQTYLCTLTTHTYAHTLTHALTCPLTQVHSHTRHGYAHMCLHTRTHTCTQRCELERTYMHMQMHTHALIHMCSHIATYKALTHAFTCIHTQTHSHTCTHAHTDLQLTQVGTFQFSSKGSQNQLRELQGYKTKSNTNTLGVFSSTSSLQMIV